MSTILDALKKSEQERKKNNVPTLSDMPAPQETSRWPWIIVAVLSLTLAVVMGILISQWLYSDKPVSQVAGGVNVETSTLTLQGGPSDSVPNTAPQYDPSMNDVIVNVVSYSEVPEQRFVMISGKMYRENDFVRAGLRVQEIKPNAVVLNQRGQLVTRTP